MHDPRNLGVVVPSTTPAIGAIRVK